VRLLLCGKFSFLFFGQLKTICKELALNLQIENSDVYFLHEHSSVTGMLITEFAKVVSTLFLVFVTEFLKLIRSSRLRKENHDRDGRLISDLN